jgi:hypothetical protein
MNMKKYVASLLLPVLVFSIAACADSDDGDLVAIPTGEAIDRDAILDSVEDVRALVRDNVASLDPMMIDDVDYSDDELKVTLAAGEDGLDSAAMQSVCDDISEALALIDLKLTVEKADGSSDVSCQFSG